MKAKDNELVLVGIHDGEMTAMRKPTLQEQDDALLAQRKEETMTSAPAIVAERLFADLERLKKAIHSYASHQPLGLIPARQLQRDLLAIAGEPHRHRKSVGDDSCLLCGRDLRHEIHLRA